MSVDEWDQRAVCPDGACIGVIGPDGLCKVCGRVAPNWGDERNRGLVDEPAKAKKVAAKAPPAEDADADEAAEVDGEAYDDDDEADGDEDEDEDDEDVGDDSAAYEWSRRKLCPDGACVGVIGPNNVCTVCGKSP